MSALTPRGNDVAVTVWALVAALFFAGVAGYMMAAHRWVEVVVFGGAAMFFGTMAAFVALTAPPPNERMEP